jgi:hypothetical protein
MHQAVEYQSATNCCIWNIKPLVKNFDKPHLYRTKLSAPHWFKKRSYVQKSEATLSKQLKKP